MSIEKVKQYFKQYNMEEKVVEFDVSSATVELAALALNCEPGKIAKSLSFKVSNRPIIIVLAGDARISNAKFKQKFGAKATMLSPLEVESMVGHKVGGVCPFAINDGVEVYLDLSLKKHDTVFPACGSSNSAIELTIKELERYSGSAEWVDIAKDEKG